MEETYYILIDGDQQGPYTAAELLDRRATGRLSPDCYAWREGMADWEPLSRILPADMPPVPAPATSSVVNAGFHELPRRLPSPSESSAIGTHRSIFRGKLNAGEASFVLGAGSFITFLLHVLLPAAPSGGFMALVFIVVGILGTGAVFAVFVGPVLAIVSLSRKQEGAAFAIWGIVLSVFAFILMAL